MKKEKTITKEQIREAIGILAKNTLDTYLRNWRFVKFERKVKHQNFYRYEYLYCKDFFNNLYTFLILKHKIYAAKNLKDSFAQAGLNLEKIEV